LRSALIVAALLCGSIDVHAQAVRPSAFPMRDVVSSRTLETTSTHDSRLTPPDRLRNAVSAAATSGIRARPIVIGVATGALLGAGFGAVLAGACDSQHCSSRDEVTTGALVGAGIGGLFGLVLGLPPRHDRE
jgi:hypothetical protein